MNNKERLYADLKRKILTLELEPGEALDETSLSQEYGISRTPLRDIFRLLAGEGYIVIRDNRGTIVSPMSHKTMRDFFLTAPMIYSATARLAALNPVKRRLSALKDIQVKFRAAVKDDVVEDMIYWNDRFHYVMGEMADNQFLMPSLQRLLIDHARIGQTFWRERDTVGQDKGHDKIEEAADQHDQFIALIEAGDAEGVVALTLDHWALSRDHMERYIRPDPLPIDMM